MTASIREHTAQFWAAVNYLRRSAPNAPLRGQAYRIIRKLAATSTGNVQQRAADFIEGTDDEPTRYNG